MFHTSTCTSVTCDACGDGWQDTDHGTSWHFESETDALRCVLEGNWARTPTGQLLCEQCAAQQACTEHGHQMEPWWDCQCTGLIKEPGHGPGGCTWQLRICERCGLTQRHCLTPPTPGRD